jgi:hypothetical protein
LFLKDGSGDSAGELDLAAEGIDIENRQFGMCQGAARQGHGDPACSGMPL